MNISQYFSKALRLQSQDSVIVIGRVVEILCRCDNFLDEPKVIVTVNKFGIGLKHQALNMPTIHCGEEERLVRVDGKVRLIICE